MQKNLSPRRKLACANSARTTNQMVCYRKTWPLAKRTVQHEQDFEFKDSKVLSIAGGQKN
jgi:hypothetical protein